MFYYLSFYVISITFNYLSGLKRNSNWLYWSVFFAFIFSALRYDAGYDFFSYLDLINGVGASSYERLEYLNRVIIEIARYFDEPQIYFALTSFLYLLFMMLGFKRLGEFTGVTLILTLFFIGGFLTSFDIIRQMVAVSLVFYAISLYLTKSKIVGFLFVIPAFLFHQSALIFFGIILFILLFSGRQMSIFFYVFALIAAYFSTKIFVELSYVFGLYSSYFEKGGNDTGGGIYILLLFFIFSLYLISKLKKIQSINFWLYFNLFFLGLLIYTALLPYGYFATRISYYLFPWGFVAYSLLINISLKNKNLIKFFVYFISSIVFF